MNDHLISRKAAIDEVKRLHDVAWANWKETRISANTMIDALKDLPSVQPELIEKAAYIRGFEQGRTQGMIDRKAEEVAQPDLQPTCNNLATDAISRQAAIEGLPSVQQEHKWETCFDCPLSHGCPKIKGCTNEQAIEYASQIPNDCPLSAQPKRKKDEDTISRQATYLALVEKGQASKRYKLGETWELNGKEIREVLDALPSVQPERKKGRWIVIEKGCKLTSYKCSECGRYIANDTGYDVKKDYPFCHCGADMREGNNE